VLTSPVQLAQQRYQQELQLQIDAKKRAKEVLAAEPACRRRR
jgi:hypothetical protein